MKTKHIAFIPARKGSVGFKFKNRLFFDRTVEFLDQANLFDDVLVSSDDDEVLNKAKQCNYLTHHRSAELSGSEVSIKTVMQNVIEDMGIDPDSYIWLFYLPILYKNQVDFENVRDIISAKKIASLCSFVSAEIHPFNCWMYDKDNLKLKKFIPNDIYRRQDLPDAWMHYHYLCVFKAGYIANLNSELISEDTYPIFLDQNTIDNLIEIDTPKDYEKWKKINPNEQ